jgi:hypothetical protein
MAKKKEDQPVEMPKEFKANNRQRNLKVKQDLINKGLHPEPCVQSFMNNKEKNLANKKALKDASSKA